MAQAQVIEGTAEKIARQLQQNYPGQRLRISVELNTETADTVQTPDISEHLKPIPNHPLAEVVGRFRDSAFFDDVVENMRLRREEENRQYAEEESS